jgi:hypothetical protein
MRLLLTATLTFLGWRAVRAIPPTFLAGNPGLVIEKATPSVQFSDLELQHRSSRFLNQATARESLSMIASLHRPDNDQHLLSMAVLFPTLRGTSEKATLAFYPPQTTRMRQGSFSSGSSRVTTPSRETKSWSGVCYHLQTCLPDPR